MSGGSARPGALALGRCLLVLLGLAWACCSKPALAHEAAPAVLALKQISETGFLARWTPPSPAPEDLIVHLPEHCSIGGNNSFDMQSAPLVPTPMECGDVGLVGQVRLTSTKSGLGTFGVNVEWQNQEQSMRLSHDSPPVVEFGRGAASTGALGVLGDYVLLGLEHILLGVDHLLFLLGLMLLVRGWKSLLATVSAFTLAHSVTLTAASLELVDVPTDPVEIGIALSVLLLGIEAAQRNPATLSRRFPWLVAFAFGLLHGLGFASALSEVGLPRNAVTVALLGFNVGVELGQLLVVGLVMLGFRLIGKRERLLSQVEWISVGALVSCSTYWVLTRVEGWLTGAGF